MQQLAEQQEKQTQQETLSEKVEKEVKVIKVMIEHVDEFVTDLTNKVGELESKLVRIAEHDASMPIRLA